MKNILVPLDCFHAFLDYEKLVKVHALTLILQFSTTYCDVDHMLILILLSAGPFSTAAAELWLKLQL